MTNKPVNISHWLAAQEALAGLSAEHLQACREAARIEFPRVNGRAVAVARDNGSTTAHNLNERTAHVCRVFHARRSASFVPQDRAADASCDCTQHSTVKGDVVSDCGMDTGRAGAPGTVRPDCGSGVPIAAVMGAVRSGDGASPWRWISCRTRFSRASIRSSWVGCCLSANSFATAATWTLRQSSRYRGLVLLRIGSRPRLRLVVVAGCGAALNAVPGELLFAPLDLTKEIQQRLNRFSPWVGPVAVSDLPGQGFCDPRLCRNGLPSCWAGLFQLSPQVVDD